MTYDEGDATKLLDILTVTLNRDYCLPKFSTGILDADEYRKHDRRAILKRYVQELRDQSYTFGQMAKLREEMGKAHEQ